jgi:hypothetical protein
VKPRIQDVLEVVSAAHPEIAGVLVMPVGHRAERAVRPDSRLGPVNFLTGVTVSAAAPELDDWSPTR